MHFKTLKECVSICICMHISSVAQSCLTLCYWWNAAMPGFPVHHQLPELAQTHVHRVSDTIPPSHPLSWYVQRCSKNRAFVLGTQLALRTSLTSCVLCMSWKLAAVSTTTGLWNHQRGLNSAEGNLIMNCHKFAYWQICKYLLTKFTNMLCVMNLHRFRYSWSFPLLIILISALFY